MMALGNVGYDRHAIDAQGFFAVLANFPQAGKNVQIELCQWTGNRKTRGQ
jgi:hypothetical protein